MKIGLSEVGWGKESPNNKPIIKKRAPVTQPALSSFPLKPDPKDVLL